MQINGFSNSPIAPGLSAYGGISRERVPMAETTATAGPVTSADATAQADSGRRVAAGSSASSSENRQQQEAEQAVVRELAARDREVRQHEMAHQAAGGQYTGGATYTFERGPDGAMYAVGGEVSIDTSPVPGDPEATLLKAQTIERAAMAPAEPSSQDLRVAAAARAMAAEARAELLREQQNALQGGDESLGVPSEQQSPGSVDANETQIAAILNQDESETVASTTDEAAEADEAAKRAAEEDEAANRMAEVIDDFEARQARREEIAEEQRERRERSAESLREFARDLAEIQDKLSELNKRLFETGALQNLNAPGSLLDRQA